MSFWIAYKILQEIDIFNFMGIIKHLLVPINKAISFLLIVSSFSAATQSWSPEKAARWRDAEGWVCGSNFIPSTAINQLEMWQAATFDTITIDRELGYAEKIGMNTMRVFLHHLAWQADREGFRSRVGRFLGICSLHHIKPFFVFFDDCWNPVYHAGTQPAPKRGKHNSGWVQDPGNLLHTDPGIVDTLHAYIEDMLLTFGHDPRVLFWDLYNEPGNGQPPAGSLVLLKQVFAWAREANPDQPLTAGVWTEDSAFRDLNAFQLANSDIITYHDYNDSSAHRKQIEKLQVYGRPLICTEYMARKRGNTFQTILPMLHARGIGAVNWGFVDGKTQTKYAWDEPHPDGSEPALWFHDIFHPDGTPYKKDETDLIRRETGADRAK